MNYNHLKITHRQAEDLLFNWFNLKGKASELPGEVDFNFRIKIENSEGYILKISRPDENENYLDFQQKLLQYIEKHGNLLLAPKVVKDKNGCAITTIADAFGNTRKVRLLTWVSGRVWNNVNPQLDNLRYSLGQQCGLLTKALQGFDHEEAHREFAWDVAQSLWTEAHIDLFEDDEKDIVTYFQNAFKATKPSYDVLRKAVVHNDANDHNVIVSEDLCNPSVKAAIDYGDAVHTQIINDLAISCAYCIMHHNNPLQAALPIIKGYHGTFPLEARELAHLYNAIAMRLVISVTKSAINKVEEPDNTYLLISEKPAWELLKKWHKISPEFALLHFREACGYTPHPNEPKFKNWASKNHFKLSDLFPFIQNTDGIHSLDLSVSSSWLGHENDFNDTDLFQFKIGKLQKQVPNKVIAGGYLEPRPFYTSAAYNDIGNNGRENRTLHLGTDFWLPQNTAVHALFDGEIVMATNDTGDKAYGGLVVLKHQIDDFVFFTLYGHLSIDSATKYTKGNTIKKGACVGELGNSSENGNWAPHLHFQIMLSVLNFKNDFPGVAHFNQMEVWKSLCPNPNLLFQLKSLQPNATIPNTTLINYRKQHLGKSLSLQYKVPIKMVRGAGQYLIDQHEKNTWTR